MKLKKGDRVRVISGKDVGKEGEITRVYPEAERVIVDGVNVAKRHQRATGPDHAGRDHRQGHAAARLERGDRLQRLRQPDPGRVPLRRRTARRSGSAASVGRTSDGAEAQGALQRRAAAAPCAKSSGSPT